MIHVFSTIITQKLNNSISMLFIILFVTFKKGKDKKIKNKIKEENLKFILDSLSNTTFLNHLKILKKN